MSLSTRKAVTPVDRPVALVTGASRGLGRSIAVAFARDGYSIGVHYNTRLDDAKATARLVEAAGASAFTVKADVAKSSQVNAMMKSIDKRFGRLDVLVNNAGLVRNRPIARMTDEEWNDVVAGNLDGSFFCTRAALPLLRRHRDGAILFMSSFAAPRGARGAANYSAAKAGVISLMKSLALEEGPNGIRTNAVLPGFHVTDINRAYWEKFEAKIREQHLLGGRMPDRDELARFIVGIAKLQSVTGQTFSFESRIW